VAVPIVFCSRKLRIAMPSASMPQTPRGALAVMRHGPCEHSEQRMPCSQNLQRVPMSSMRSNAVLSPAARVCSSIVLTEPW
jgi:hypothetical protein